MSGFLSVILNEVKNLIAGDPSALPQDDMPSNLKTYPPPGVREGDMRIQSHRLIF
jgi:hypothetical protein